MIQRVQTIYLFLAAVLMSLTLFMPLATMTQGDVEVVLKAFSISGLDNIVQSTQLPLYLGILLVLPTLLPLVTIFLFKKRMLQIRLCVSQIVLQVGALAFIGIYCYRLWDSWSAYMTEIGVKPAIVFDLGLASLTPAISIVFVVLAIRGIAKDEALVRSLDRIR